MPFKAGNDPAEWFNINRLPVYTIEPEIFREMAASAPREEKLLIGMSAEICSLFTDALEIYKEATSEWAAFSNGALGDAWA